jgi:mevalonate kinase
MKVSSHGKVIWMGEHAVVYGHQAIALPLFQVGCDVDLTKSEKTYIKSSFYEGYVEDMDERFLSIQSLIQRLNQYFHINVHMNITLRIPLSAGLGASASIASAIIQAYYQLCQETLSQEKHVEWIQQSEMIAHGNASGIDAHAMTLKNAFIFKKNEPIMPLKTSLDAYIFIVYTDIEGHTKEAVMKVKDRLLLDAFDTETKLNTLGQLTKDMVQYMKEKAHTHIGRIMTEAHHLLHQLGVSHPTLDQLCALTLRHGALGAKLTGGGLGGCMMAYFLDEASLNQAIEKVKETGFHTYFIQKV